MYSKVSLKLATVWGCLPRKRKWKTCGFDTKIQSENQTGDCVSCWELSFVCESLSRRPWRANRVSGGFGFSAEAPLQDVSLKEAEAAWRRELKICVILVFKGYLDLLNWYRCHSLFFSFLLCHKRKTNQSKINPNSILILSLSKLIFFLWRSR